SDGAPGAVAVPEILVGFTDSWVFRRCGLHGYGWSPMVRDEEERRRIHRQRRARVGRRRLDSAALNRHEGAGDDRGPRAAPARRPGVPVFESLTSYNVSGDPGGIRTRDLDLERVAS